MAGMALFEEEPARRRPAHEIGQDLTLLSVEELEERIAMLRAEAERLEAELRKKGTSKAAAAAFFKR
jgi:uncharacterized small protein (DUF1192 family)